MKRLHLILAAAVCVSVASVTWYARRQIGISKPTLSYRVAPAFSQHQPVVVEIVIDNLSDSPLDASLGRDQLGSFHFTLRRPDGTSIRVEPGAPRGAGGFTRRAERTVAPNSSSVDRVLLNPWLTFEEVGDYPLHVRFDGSIRTQNHEVPVDRDVQLMIRVVPRNEALLVDTAAHLLDVIRMGHIPGQTAAEELSYMNDPVAVHYLDRAMQVNPDVDNLAIRALERIGNDEARQVLERALVSRRYYTPGWARGALDRLNAKQK